MKTLRHADGRKNIDATTVSVESRRRRTLTSLDCQPLEGRRLMSGMPGSAGAMSGLTPMDMANPNSGGGSLQHPGGSRFDGPMSHHFIAANGQTSASPNTSTDAGGAQTGNAMGRWGNSQNLADGLGDDPGMGRFGVDGNFGGGGPGGLDGVDLPMSGQTGQGNQTGASTQLGTDSAKLEADAQAIHDKSQVTPALLTTVRKDLEAIDKAKTGVADATLLKTLQTDEQAARSSQTAPTDAQQTQIQADRDAVLKSQGVPQPLIDQLANDRLAVKTASNMTAADQALIDADRQAVAKDRAALGSSTNGATGANAAAPPVTSTSPGSNSATPPAAGHSTPVTALNTTPVDASTTSPVASATPQGSSATAPVALTATLAPPVPSGTSQMNPTSNQTSPNSAATTPGNLGQASSHLHGGRMVSNHHRVGSPHPLMGSSGFGGSSRRASRR